MVDVMLYLPESLSAPSAKAENYPMLGAAAEWVLAGPIQRVIPLLDSSTYTKLGDNGVGSV